MLYSFWQKITTFLQASSYVEYVFSYMPDIFIFNLSIPKTGYMCLVLKYEQKYICHLAYFETTDMNIKHIPLYKNIAFNGISIYDPHAIFSNVWL